MTNRSPISKGSAHASSPLCYAYNGKPPRKHALGSDQLGHGPITWEDRSKITATFTSAALDFIKKAEAAKKPFYVNVWPDDVHSPFFPPKARRGDAKKHTLYNGVLDTADEQLGVLFDYIRNNDSLRDNTLILVCSDNGPEPGAGRAGPLRGNKTMLYEGGIRSPLVVWGPGLVNADKAGSANTKSVFAAIDLVPTILQITGTAPPADANYDGQPLPDVLLGKSDASRGELLFFRRPPDRGSFYGDPNLPDLAIRDGNWKFLCDYDGSNPQLYDLANDQSETKNLADKHADIVTRLTEAVITWHKSLPPDTGPTYQPKRR